MTTTSIGLATKAEEIRAEGLPVFQSGNVPLFTGFSPDLRRKFIAAMKFKPGSEYSVMREIIEPLERLEGEDTQLFLAGRDFPLHSTLAQGLYEGSGPGHLRIFESLQRNETLIGARASLRGLVINYPFLVADKAGNILLLAEEIPPLVQGCRAKLAAMYESYELEPQVSKNLLHITIARVVKCPKELALYDFLLGLEGLRQSLLVGRNNLVASGEMAAGSLYNFLV